MKEMEICWREFGLLHAMTLCARGRESEVVIEESSVSYDVK